MKSIWQRLSSILPWMAAGTTVTPALAQSTESDALWQSAYSAREAYYRANFGDLPSDILKVGHVIGVWPGGGLFVIPAKKIGPDTWVYTTFGLTNPDMPTGVAVSDVCTQRDDKGRVVGSSGTLQKKQRAEAKQGAAGYGYEFVVIARENAQWPLWILQWAINAELLNDAGFLERVDKYAGLTVEDVQVGDNQSVNLLIARARSPLPTGTMLPNGKMEILVATTITSDEMKWSMEHGREALLQRLQNSGVGQLSRPGRKSVLQ